MKPKQIIILISIVLLPLAVMLWLGARLVRDEQYSVERRIEQLVRNELNGVADTVSRSISGYEELLITGMSPFTTETEALRQRTRESPHVLQYYVVDREGRLLHPPIATLENLTRKEREALERTRRIWLDGVLLSGAAEGEATSQNRGWHAWYREEGLQFLFWSREGDRLHVAELNRVRFMSEIVAFLPETASEDDAAPRWRIRLLDSKQMPLYQWGPYEPPEDARPAFETPLRAPVGAWSLQYFADDEALGTAVAGSFVLNALVGFLVLAAAVIGLTYLFYREQSREMRDAAQRVSFVNQVSHELKTPLTNIRMYAELLERRLPDGDEPSEQHLDVIVSESQRLSRLIGNILTFSREQKRTLALHRQPGIVDEVLRETLEHFRPSLQANAIEARFSAGAGETVSLDRDAVEQIVGNLVGNVEKYGRAGGSLELTSEQDGDTVTITIADQGPGIPRPEWQKVFQPFYRVSDSLTEGVSGSGIGLSVARELTRLHGGDLELVPSDGGARFRLTLHCPIAGEEDRS